MRAKIDSVFVLTVFCVFAASVLLVIMLAASAYAGMNEISESGRDERVLLSYVRTKIRGADSYGAVSVGKFHGSSALIISENFGGREFLTKIYLYDGVVRELFFEAGGEFFPEDGTVIVRTERLEFSAPDGGVQICTGLGSSFILPRAGS